MRLKKLDTISINIEEILNAVTAFFLVLNCQSVWQKSLDANYHIYELCLFFVLLDTLYSVICWSRHKQMSKYGIIISVSYLVLLFFVVCFSVSLDDLVRFLSRFLVFPFFMLHFCSAAPKKQKLGFFFWYFQIMVAIAWVSIFFWLLASLNIIHATSIINVDWFGQYDSYYGVYFSSPYQCIDWIGVNIRRNIGIFTEGPMFMFTLVIAFLLSDFLAEYFIIRKWQIVGIVVALITVGSVTGYAILLFIFGMKLMHKFKDRTTQIMLGMFALVFLGLCTCGLLTIKKGTASFIARFDDYAAGFKAWIKSPIYGNGYENLDSIRSFFSSSRTWNQGFSNTILSVLAYGGILFVIPFIVPIVRGLYYSFKKKDYRLFQFSFIHLLLYFAVIFYTFYINFAIWAFLMSEYKDLQNSRLRKMKNDCDLISIKID